MSPEAARYLMDISGQGIAEMALFRLGLSNLGDGTNLSGELGGLRGDAVVDATSTSFRLQSGTSVFDEVEGAGFTFSDPGSFLNTLTGGTVSTLRLVQGPIGQEVPSVTATGLNLDGGRFGELQQGLSGTPLVEFILSGRDKVIGSTGGDGLSGGAKADRLIGKGGSDFLDGGAGNDRLIGGGGGDIMTGGGGRDSFVFNSKPKSSDPDRIADFSGRDRLQFDDRVFTGIGPRGPLDPDAFHVGTRAADAEDRFIYDADLGRLFYDQDGRGGVRQKLVATFDFQPALDVGDFFVI
jgi:Ca2+-binding RTX toxin-like protein